MRGRASDAHLPETPRAKRARLGVRGPLAAGPRTRGRVLPASQRHWTARWRRLSCALGEERAVAAPLAHHTGYTAAQKQGDRPGSPLSAEERACRAPKGTELQSGLSARQAQSRGPGVQPHIDAHCRRSSSLIQERFCGIVPRRTDTAPLGRPPEPTKAHFGAEHCRDSRLVAAGDLATQACPSIPEDALAQLCPRKAAAIQHR